MTPKITDEQRRALAALHGQPVPAKDEQTQEVYFIYTEDLHERAMQAMRREEDIASIQRGVEQMEAGKGRPLADADAAMRKDLGFQPPQ